MDHAGHALADARSLALHRAVADLLLDQPHLVEQARLRVEGWIRDGGVARPLAEGWRLVLQSPPSSVATFLVDGGEHARRLRQASPFAGVLDPRVRWSIWRSVSR